MTIEQVWDDAESLLRTVRRNLGCEEGESLAELSSRIGMRRFESSCRVFLESFRQLLQAVHGIPVSHYGHDLEPAWQRAKRMQQWIETHDLEPEFPGAAP